MKVISGKKTDSYTSLGWKEGALIGTFMWAAVLGFGAGILRAQKPAALPADPEGPRLDLLPGKLQPKRIDLPHTATSPGESNPQDYIISPDDELSVDVMDVPEFTKIYRVSPTGEITVPLLPKPVMAVGLTLDQLAKTLGDELKAEGLVSHPIVTVSVSKSRLHEIAIAGAVMKPQMYQVLGKTTVLDAIAKAEGLAQDAGNTAIITRGDAAMRIAEMEQGNGGKTQNTISNSRTVHVDLNRLLEEGDVTQNFTLYPGDRISVQRAGIFYVVGAVNKPGGFVLKDDRQQMTVLKALALSEYTKNTAAPKRTIIVREAPKSTGGTQDIPVELDKILKGRAKDRVLLANDILFIPESGSKIALHRAAETAAQGATLLFYRVP